MFQVIKNGSNRIDIELSGKVDSDAMRVALDDLIMQSQGVQNGRMLYRISDFRMPTLGAIGVEFSRLPGLFKLLGRFDRVAVVAEQQWLKKAAEIEGAIIPGLEIKAFDLDDADRAEAWLAG